jgi:hypothetical protein
MSNNNLVGLGQLRGQDPRHMLRGTERRTEGSSESGAAAMMGVEQKEHFSPQLAIYTGLEQLIGDVGFGKCRGV